MSVFFLFLSCLFWVFYGIQIFCGIFWMMLLWEGNCHESSVFFKLSNDEGEEKHYLNESKMFVKLLYANKNINLTLLTLRIEFHCSCCEQMLCVKPDVTDTQASDDTTHSCVSESITLVWLYLNVLLFSWRSCVTLIMKCEISMWFIFLNNRCQISQLYWSHDTIPLIISELILTL